MIERPNAPSQIDDADIPGTGAPPGRSGVRLGLNFRTLMYAAIVTSGCVALVFQVVWQKYLAFLVGSEARSISIVVAIFLLGLAIGYRFWGNVTERKLSRHLVLKVVGYIELAIAGYGILFPHIFDLVRPLSYAAPDWLLADLLIASALLLFPTFLMGASIPMLTAAVPEDAAEVNYCHSRIYGLNTLGAFGGAFLGGFYLAPTFGLPSALAIAAAANVLVALVFITNRLSGDAHKAEEIPTIPNRFGTTGIYLFVFTTGAVTIGYEIIFMRILGLSAGSGHYIFPIVVGVVILGLAIGSLSIRRDGVTERQVFVELLAIVGLLSVIYLTVPYWGYWISHIRVSLTSIESNHGVFMAALSLFVALMLLPVAIPLGRLLPTGYSLIDKTRNDYGKVCGRVYFVNTVGTVFGAVGIGYAMFRFMDLGTIFKLNIVLLVALVAFLFLQSRRPGKALATGVLAVVVVLLPTWDRGLHYVGAFRMPVVQDFHFQGPFTLPEFVARENRLWLSDDPNTTVAVFSGSARLPGNRGSIPSLTIAVNGKSDGNSIGDYSNMTLSGMLPYLHAHRSTDLKAAVIGLGTGITSGVLAGADGVGEVVTLEISSAVIEAARFFNDVSFGLPENPRSTLVQDDAFRYLSRTDERFDIIASEPSNPWVVGVENLFTPEYYELAGSRLGEGGIFFQWVQIYEMDNEVFAAIVENVVTEFPHVAMYLIGRGDVGIVASYDPLRAPHLEFRLGQPFVKEALAPMHLDDPSLLPIMTLFEGDQLRTVPLISPRSPHRLSYPWLGYEAGRARFLARQVVPRTLISPYVARHHGVPLRRAAGLQAWLESPGLEGWLARCDPAVREHSAEFICERALELEGAATAIEEPLSVERLSSQLRAYGLLRSQGYIGPDPERLHEARRLFLDGWDAFESAGERHEAANRIISELADEWLWEGALETAEAFWEAGAVTEEVYRGAERRIGEGRAYVVEWRRLREARGQPVP